MKTEKTIYVKCDKYFVSNNPLLAVLLACTVVSVVSFALNANQTINSSSAYAILSICGLLAAFSVYRLSKEPPQRYIYINEDEITFKQNKSEDEVRLKFEGLDYFETRFSEIIFSTKAQEKIVLPLDRVSNEQKRWEIKEFLRGHVKQINCTFLAA